MDSEPIEASPPEITPQSDADPNQHCPVCGALLLHEKCKVVCRSPKRVYRIVFNCAEF